MFYVTCRAVQIGITYEPVAKDAMENGDIDITVQACGRTLKYICQLCQKKITQTITKPIKQTGVSYEPNKPKIKKYDSRVNKKSKQ